jgi:Protein of unknown function (DUF1800)
MELFTLGIGHFSEGDVKEAARALTGWAVADGAFLEYAANHDPGQKTILGQSDPQSSAVLAEPRSARDLMVTAVSGRLLAYDNISVLPNWLSDSLCWLATGGGMASRAFFSNDERNLINAQRPVLLNGIDEFVRRDDLADRCVFLHPLPKSADRRRTEVEFW